MRGHRTETSMEKRVIRRNTINKSKRIRKNIFFRRRRKAWWPGLYPLLKRLSLSAFVLQTDTTGKHCERFLDTRPNVMVLIGVFI